MFDGRWREAVDRTTSPVGEALHRHGITADVLTATGLVSATGTVTVFDVADPFATTIFAVVPLVP